MASASVGEAGRAPAGAALVASATGSGSAAHPYFGSEELLRGPNAFKNLADAVHFLCMLHGRHPGVIDLAAARVADPAAQAWLARSAEAFAGERRYLGRISVAAGPVPGTPGGGASEATVTGQRSAIATLARSERDGCALGAALGLAADWTLLRPVLDSAARRLGVDVARSALPGLEEIGEVAAAASATPAVERALLFGAQQIFVQHHGLWALLEARQQARRGG